MLAKYKKWQLYILIFMLIMSFICAIYTPIIFNYFDFIGIIFINLLKLCAIPIIVSSLILTISSFNKSKQFSSTIITIILYILLSEIIAVIIGMLIFNHIELQSFSNNKFLISTIIKNQNYTPITQQYNSHDIFNYIFTDNLFKSMANFEVLPLVIFAIIFGLIIRNDQYPHIVSITEEIKNSFNKLLQIVILFSPLALFVLIGEAVKNSYQDGNLITNLLLLSKFILFFILGLILQFLWQFIIVILNNKYKIKKLITNLQQPITIAFITSSSLATLAIAIKHSKEIGSNKEISEFMLPITCSMNLASGMMYEMVACLFFMQLLNIHPSITDQIFLAIMCIITGIAVGGIPETSMISFVTIFTFANIPLSAIAILLPLDRIIDRIRTMVNISCNIMGTLIISIIHNKINQSQKNI